MKIPKSADESFALGLFDKSFYEEELKRQFNSNEEAFEHFLNQNSEFSINPNAWFDCAFYNLMYPEVLASGQNPFIHYVEFGKQEGRFANRNQVEVNDGLSAGQKEDEVDDTFVIESSLYYSDKEYLRINPDLKEYKGDLHTHYLDYGYQEGRHFSDLFDVDYYKDKYMDSNRNENPLLHFERVTKQIGIIPNTRGVKPFNLPLYMNELDFDSFSSAIHENSKIDVIVPVYKGYIETLNCLKSLFQAKTQTLFNLVVINDSSPVSSLTLVLRLLASRGLFEYIENRENLGFVKSVNLGMRLHEERDVILLNSDTEVYDFWIDRLLAHRNDGSVATITPLSNNATICSYPNTLANNSYLLENEQNELSDIVYEVNKGKSVDVPTGVGFCFYISRESLNSVGYFDEKAFGKGYGEENDYCVRVSDSGYRNILALDTYVTHFGEVSFAEGAKESQAIGLKELIKKHPNYLNIVENYILRDPSQSARINIDLKRLKLSLGDKVILFISHSFGGGIEKHCKDLELALSNSGYKVVHLLSTKNETSKFSIEFSEYLYTPNLKDLDVHSNQQELEQLLDIIGPEIIHIHSLTGFSQGAREEVMSLISKYDGKTYYTLHDYSSVCPHNHLVKPKLGFCGGPKLSKCQSCVNNHKPYFGWVDMERYVKTYSDFLKGVDKIFAPSKNVLNFYSGDYKDIEFLPHMEYVSSVAPPSIKPNTNDIITVAIVGAIGFHKGMSVINACKADADSRKLPIRYRIIGYADNSLMSNSSVEQTGAYTSDDEARSLLDKIKPDVLFIPSIWPETYCYTLSFSFNLGIPCLAFDIGAQEERIKESKFGMVIPEHFKNDVKQINNFILATDWADINNENREEYIGKKVSVKSYIQKYLS